MTHIEMIYRRAKASKTAMAFEMLIVVGVCVGLSRYTTLALMVLVWAVASYEIYRALPWTVVNLRQYVLSRLLLAQVTFGLGSLVWLRFQPQGLLIILVVASAVFINDAAAQATGKTLKSKGYELHPLAPKISPNKSIEGLIGGLTGGWVAGFWAIIIVSLFTPALPPVVWLVVLCCPLLAVVGDLVESATKRSVRIKDFGTVLGEHGGICDRIDAITMAAIGTVLILFLSGAFMM